MRKQLWIAALGAAAAVSYAAGNEKANAWTLVTQLTPSVDSYLSAKHELMEMKLAAVPALINGMSSRDEYVRASCAEIVSRLGAKSFGSLSVALNTPSWRVRSSAAMALGMMPPSRKRNALLASAVRDDHWWVRAVALNGLRGARDANSRVAVQSAMDDPDLRVRQRANDSEAARPVSASAQPR